MPQKKTEKKPEPEFTIIRDTREQTGWKFNRSLPCLGTVERALKTGDYSIEGYEDRFVIERKGSVQEVWNNLTSKEDWPRFQAELERLEEIEFPFLICEFHVSDVLKFPLGTPLPRKTRYGLRFKGAFLLRRLLELEVNYRTRVLFAGTKGKELAKSLCKRMAMKFDE